MTGNMEADLKSERARRHLREIANEAGPMLSAAEASVLLAIPLEELEKLRTSRSIISVRAGGEWWYPELQFRAGRPLPRLKEIIAAHHGINSWVALDSLLAPDTANGGRSILELLRQGDDDCLDRALLQLHEQYASSSG